MKSEGERHCVTANENRLLIIEIQKENVIIEVISRYLNFSGAWDIKHIELTADELLHLSTWANGE